MVALDSCSMAQVHDARQTRSFISNRAVGGPRLNATIDQWELTAAHTTETLHIQVAFNTLLVN